MSQLLKTAECPRCGAPCYDLSGPGPEDKTAKVCHKNDSHFWCVLCTCPREDLYSCDGFFARIIPTPDATKKQRYAAKMSCDDRRKLLQPGSGDVHSRLRLQWITQTLRAARQLSSAKAQVAADLWTIDYIFWIRLYGVLAEINDFLTRLHAPKFDGDRPKRRFEPTLRAIKNVASVFNNDELLYIQYRRDEGCHPVASAYELGQRDDGKLIEEIRKTLTGQPVKHDTFDQAVAALIRRYKRNEFAIACDFAKRALPALEALRAEALKIFT